ncbi:hypothetical protein [Undibacterium sp. TJN19]|uniref:hypothetical protein n=1 Tax=Undibacterium sp. TJN19 TaxID=3413055 RepID=UPI003BEFD9EC
MEHPVYLERQWIVMIWIILPLVTLFSLGTQLLAGVHIDTGLMLIAPLVNLLVLTLLGRMTLSIDATHLRWSFGLFGWPAWNVALADIATAGATTTRWIEGRGIKKTSQGMLYNASGNAAIRITLRNGTSLRLGTQDPQRLLSYLLPRLAPNVVR